MDALLKLLPITVPQLPSNPKNRVRRFFKKNDRGYSVGVVADDGVHNSDLGIAGEALELNI